MTIRERKGPINVYITLYFLGGRNDFVDVSENKIKEWIKFLSSSRELDDDGKVLWEFSDVQYAKQQHELQSIFSIVLPREITTREGSEIIQEVEKVEVHIRLKTGIAEIRTGRTALSNECVLRVAESLFGDPKYFSKIVFNDLDFEKVLSLLAESTGTRLDHLWHKHFDEIGFKGTDVTKAKDYDVYRDAGGKTKMISGIMPLPSKRAVSLIVYRWGRLRFAFVDQIDWSIIEETLGVIEKILA